MTDKIPPRKLSKRYFRTDDYIDHLEAVAKVAVEALRCLLEGVKGDQLILNPNEFIKGALRRIEESGWRSDDD